MKTGKTENSKIRYINRGILVIQSLSHVRLCDTMDCSTSAFPVRHQLPELAQTHVHQVGDAIQPSYPLSVLGEPMGPGSSPAQLLCSCLGAPVKYQIQKVSLRQQGLSSQADCSTRRSGRKSRSGKGKGSTRALNLLCQHFSLTSVGLRAHTWAFLLGAIYIRSSPSSKLSF